MKKWIVLLIACLLCACCACALAEKTETEKITSGDYIYNLLPDGTAKIVRYKGRAEELDIASELDGYAVTSIGEGAFSGGSSLTSVTIPDSVTSIGDMAFFNCRSLTSVTILDSVTSIGNSAFSYCSSLTSVTIPNSVTSIGDSAFYDCRSLTSVTIPNSVTSIGDWAFSGCRSLTSVTIPDSVTSIGDSAFSRCSSLTNISIPRGVTAIGPDAFYKCSIGLSVTVQQDSYAEEYCKENNLYYLIAGVTADQKTSRLATPILGTWEASKVEKINKNSLLADVTSADEYTTTIRMVFNDNNTGKQNIYLNSLNLYSQSFRWSYSAEDDQLIIDNEPVKYELYVISGKSYIRMMVDGDVYEFVKRN